MTDHADEQMPCSRTLDVGGSCLSLEAEQTIGIPVKGLVSYLLFMSAIEVEASTCVRSSSGSIRRRTTPKPVREFAHHLTGTASTTDR